MSLKRQYAEFVAQSNAQSAQDAADAAAAQLHSSWFYMASGTEQGPHSLQSMVQWFKQGYFQMVSVLPACPGQHISDWRMWAGVGGAQDVPVRQGGGGEFFALRCCPEIAGESAEPRTIEQWKGAGNRKLGMGDAEGALACYTAGLALCPAALTQEEVVTSEEQLQRARAGKEAWS
jgi:hypothetical protein